jgi:outer membrane protein TolC
MGTALRHYQRAAAGYEQSLGAGHSLTLGCQGELARAYYDVGHAGDAVTLLRAAITAAGQALSPDDPVTSVLRGLLDEITNEMTVR